MSAESQSRPDAEQEAQRLAAESTAAGEPNAWFERLYAAARRGDVDVPWDRGGPHPLLVEWAQRDEIDGAGRRAVVTGCGLGDDAEFVSSLGFRTTAFDLSETAVACARARFPESSVEYALADLLDLPPAWREGFDLVVESVTIQSMPRLLRQQAIAGVRDLIAPGGSLLVISGALGDEDDPDAGPPWRITRAELDTFAGTDLAVTSVERIAASATVRWRATFLRG